MPFSDDFEFQTVQVAKLLRSGNALIPVRNSLDNYRANVQIGDLAKSVEQRIAVAAAANTNHDSAAIRQDFAYRVTHLSGNHRLALFRAELLEIDSGL